MWFHYDNYIQPLPIKFHIGYCSCKSWKVLWIDSNLLIMIWILQWGTKGIEKNRLAFSCIECPFLQNAHNPPTHKIGLASKIFDAWTSRLLITILETNSEILEMILTSIQQPLSEHTQFKKMNSLNTKNTFTLGIIYVWIIIMHNCSKIVNLWKSVCVSGNGLQEAIWAGECLCPSHSGAVVLL